MGEHDDDIKKFVSLNQPCKMEEIVEGLQDKISRGPLYNAVEVLLQKGVLVDDMKNRRDHRIFVNKENLLVTFPPKLELFKNSLLDLVKSSPKEFSLLYKKYGPKAKDLKGFENDMMILEPLEILFYTIDMLTLTSTIIWPKKMKNRESIRELYPIIFSNISDILMELFDFLNPKYDFPNLFADFKYLDKRRGLTGSPLALIAWDLFYYSIINLKDKMELVADSLWSLSWDLRQFEHLTYGGPDYYTKNDWREAITHLKPTLYDIPGFLKKKTK